MSGDVGGYEWGYTCPECETFHDLSGMAIASARATVNGEEGVFRVRSLEPGDTVECAECGHAIELTFLDPDRPDNLDRAVALLRRQQYGDVADYIEREIA